MHVSKPDYSIEIDEFSDKGTYNYISMNLTEGIKGVLPTGTLVFESQTFDFEEDLKEINLRVSDNKNVTYSLRGIIHSRTIKDVYIYYGLTFANPEFLHVNTKTFTGGLDSAINSLYARDIDSNILSNVSGVELFQCNQTDYDFCTRLLYGHSKDTVFAYTIEGLNIFNLRKPSVEYSDFDENYSSNAGSATTFMYRRVDEAVTEIDASLSNLSTIKFDNYLIQTDSNYKNYYDNICTNVKLCMGLSLSTTLRYSAMTPYKVGEKILVTNTQANLRDFLVTSKSLTLSKSINSVVELSMISGLL